MDAFLAWCVKHKDHTCGGGGGVGEDVKVGDVLKQSATGHYQFDFEKLAKSCENEVNAFTMYTLALQVLSHDKLQSGLGQMKILRSSLTTHLTKNKVELTTLATQNLKNWMRSRASEDMKAKMRAENPIKYSNARDSLSFAVYEELTGKLFRDNRLFLWMIVPRCSQTRSVGDEGLPAKIVESGVFPSFQCRASNSPKPSLWHSLKRNL